MFEQPGFFSASVLWLRRFLLVCLLLNGCLAGLAANQPASITLTNPPPGCVIVAGDLLPFGATALDSDGIVTAVEFFGDDVLLTQDLSAPFGGFWTNVPAGVHSIYAVAVDDALERSTSSVRIVTVNPPSGPRALFWSQGAQVGGDWNSTDFNWRLNAGGPCTLFRPGDLVTIPSSTIFPSRLFIGSAGTPAAVSPGRVMLNGGTLQGGDIATGSLEVLTGTAKFTNYGTSLSFPGGTTISSGSSLVFAPSLAPNGASLRFGNGPIELRGGYFDFGVKRNETATLENDFKVPGTGSFSLGGSDNSNTVCRFTGALNLSGTASFSIQNGLGFFLSAPADPVSHEWAGPIVLDQTAPLAGGQGHLIRTLGSYRTKGLLLSGVISDSAGVSSYRLEFENYAVPHIRLTAANTYSRGTLIRSSPSAPAGRVEVGPNGTLGTGDVEVQGVLRLMGSQNVASNRAVSVLFSGLVILEPGVVVRLNSLRLGNSTFTIGTFSATNGLGYLRSNGTFRLPATNIPPSVMVFLPSGYAFPPGPATVQTTASDPDGFVQRVDLQLNGTVVATRTNSPYNFTLSNPPAGTYQLRAVAYDDEGGARASAVAVVTFPLRIERIETAAPRAAVLVFTPPLDKPFAVESADALPSTAWTNLASFPAVGGPLSAPYVRWTNFLPTGVDQRFYRLTVP